MLNIAVAGLGTVGASVITQLQANATLIASRTGNPIVIKAVSARDKGKKRLCDFSGIPWVDDPLKLADMPGIDVVVEVIGGAEGIARKLAEETLEAGKHLVTGNKALIAAHGATLAKLAESHHAQLSFEAAVAGGIPVIKTLREGLAGDQIVMVRGILNGTCNYILTRMREQHLPFDLALAEAQKLGYAESDPSADIDGHDTAHKLAILAALAFGTEPDLAAVRVEGIRRILPLDLEFAAELGCRVKLLGVARNSGQGTEQRVGPSLVAKDSPLAKVDGVLNALLVRGQLVGDITLEGRGAGGEPTANAVVADLIDIARGIRTQAFSTLSTQIKKSVAGPARPTGYYMRMQVADKPGVVADISAILRDEAISIESLLQRGKSAVDSVPLVITTHASDALAMRRVADKIAKLSSVAETPCLMPIED